MNNLYNVMTKRNKDALLNIRIRKEVRAEIKAAAELRGTDVAGLLHPFIRSVINEQKQSHPEEFQRLFEEFWEEENSPKVKDKGVPRPPINPTNPIQEQPGLHRLDEGKNKSKGTKQADEIIENLDLENFDTDYGDFDEPEKK
jgi:hypothetical protein